MVAAVGEILGAAGVRGEGWRLQREATGGGGAPGRRVGDSARRINGRGGREGAPRRRRAALSAAREKTEQGGGGGRKGSFCNYQKFQGLNCKPAITFKPKLKWKSAEHESCSTFHDLQL